MSLTNTLVVDLSSQTVTLTSYEGANLVESLIYTLSTNTVQFGIRAAVTIPSADYFALVAQSNLFQNAIVQNFTINQFATQPFTSFIGNETYISFINEWNLEVTVNSTMFINDVTPYSAAQTSLNNRASADTINYSEWSMTLNALNHYAVSLHNFLGI